MLIEKGEDLKGEAREINFEAKEVKEAAKGFNFWVCSKYCCAMVMIVAGILGFLYVYLL